QGGGQSGGNRNGDPRNQQSPSNQNQQANSGGGPIRSSGQRQAGSELREYLKDAEALRRELGKDRDLARGLDQAIQGLRQANDAINRDDMQTALLLKDQVIEPLRGLEMELSKRVQAKLGTNRLRLGDEGSAPAGYRKLVDEYYKRLSSQKQNQ
ncbi:MAG TPA: hypothetical protein PLK30_12585, partial [Blastocatellia bacterium]|nr:hypothetical protein [Blastocatellia bacterium]